jgi:hypothetical protein
MHSKHAWLSSCTPFHSTALYEGFVFGVVEEFLMVVAHPECGSKHGGGCFVRKVLAAFDVGNLIHGQFAKLCKLLLAHIRVKSQFLDTDAEIGLNRLHTISAILSEQFRKLVHVAGCPHDLILGFFASFSAYIQNWPIDMLK